jgi:hypothetical protein
MDHIKAYNKHGKRDEMLHTMSTALGVTAHHPLRSKFSREEFSRETCSSRSRNEREREREDTLARIALASAAF